MKNLRLRVKLGLIIGILVLSVIAVAVTGYLEMRVLNGRVEQMVEKTSKAAYLMGDIWSNVQRARRFEFRAVLATDAKETKNFADQARELSKIVDDAYPGLSDLINPSRKSADRQSLDKFHGSWEEYRKIQNQTLDLAADNSIPREQDTSRKGQPGASDRLVQLLQHSPRRLLQSHDGIARKPPRSTGGRSRRHSPTYAGLLNGSWFWFRSWEFS